MMRMNKRLALMVAVLVMLFAVSPAMAAEDPGPLEALGINLGFLIAQIVNFGLIFFFLMYFLWGPMTNRLDERSKKIEKGLEDAARAAEARRNAEAEADKILAQARMEATQVVDEGRDRGEEMAKSIEAEARKEAEKIREDARIAAQGEISNELANMRGQVSTIAVAVAQRLIGEELDAKKQQALIDDFFSKVPADAKSLTGSVEVVSAMPLSDSEQTKVKKAIGADDVTFTVNQNILGGLIVRSGDRVIDGSVRRELDELAGRIG
ncbi:MAG: ATP synthase F0 subunit B [Anaerolineaceae bacterium]|nr:MAG: ATP synthase F0 subunit B [Anaerolineaceae bacterium]